MGSRSHHTNHKKILSFGVRVPFQSHSKSTDDFRGKVSATYALVMENLSSSTKEERSRGGRDGHKLG